MVVNSVTNTVSLNLYLKLLPMSISMTANNQRAIITVKTFASKDLKSVVSSNRLNSAPKNFFSSSFALFYSSVLGAEELSTITSRFKFITICFEASF